MPQRTLPRFPEPETEPFWRATAEHRLTYQTCDDCSSVVFYPRLHCTECGSPKLTWHDSQGMGTVYTYSVIRQNRSPDFRDIVPYVLAYVDLDEGFRMMTNIVGIADPGKDVRIGQRVRVQWEDQEGANLSLPLFTPA
jgi:uncharacterized OB-fold protein